MVSCAACATHVRGGVVCPSCKSTSHHECVRLPAGATISDSWRCGACQANAPKGRDPSTPVRADRLNYAAPEEPMALDETANNITAEFTDAELQLQMDTDLDIGNLPEERGESVVHAVTVLAAKLGVVLEERDVVFAERVGAPPRGEGPEGGAAPARPRRVVVRLARRDLRDRLLQGARVRRTLTAADAGRDVAAAARIFVNERLTRPNRQLFHRVREECRLAQWRFAWTKRGRVYARQAEGKPAFPLRSEADVVRVFGPTRV